MHIVKLFVFLIATALAAGCGTSESKPSTVAARTDLYQTLIDSPLTLAAPGVLENDTNENGRSLAVSSFDASTFEGGTVAMAATGGFTYTPPAGFSGEDYFTYTAVGGEGVNTGEVLIEVLADFESLPSFREVKKRTASDAETGDDLSFFAVAVNGDYAIVGARGKDSGAGAAYIFYRNQGGENNWGEVKKLTASDAEAQDWFGISVAISGDCAIVGAHGEDSGGDYAGAAYLFYRNQGGANNWGEVKKITASDTRSCNYFGISVSISGDNALIGARGANSSVGGSGAAYLLRRNQGGANNWGEVKKLAASDPATSDSFGGSVSIDGDYAVVGADGEDSGGSSAGAAYIFYRHQGGANNWGEVKKLTASDSDADDQFGNSVSISGGYALVGAYGEDSGGSNAGAAYIFHRGLGGADNWGEASKLAASSALADNRFGCDVSISGNYALVGSFDSEAAYLFHHNQGGFDNWGEVSTLTPTDAPCGVFGHSVSLCGDRAVVGAPFDSFAAYRAGSAYFFERE